VIGTFVRLTEASPGDRVGLAGTSAHAEPTRRVPGRNELCTLILATYRPVSRTQRGIGAAVHHDEAADEEPGRR
jgi:hypothetical protein